jgi:metal-sulfur cluster biosynthetic enzyme
MSTPDAAPDSDADAGPTREAIRERLDRVTDPELDTSIVELGYVDAVEVDGERVTVAITLPTAWCSPAFAWMMATDARDEVESLAGVTTARVVLRDHVHGDEITGGVNTRRSFAETFPDADGGVAEIRATLDEKARLARQHDAVDALLEAGLDPEQVVGLTRADLGLESDPAAVYLPDRSMAVTVPREPLASYLRKASATGRVTDPGDRLFRTPEGDPIPPERFELVRRRTRLAQVNMSGQAGLCEGLNEVRRAKLDRPDAVGDGRGRD